jgi:acyl transferase domain-containing protein
MAARARARSFAAMRVSLTTHRAASSLALVFPGQGAQRPGMGADLAAEHAAACLVFEEVDDALGERLSRTMFTGSEVGQLGFHRESQGACSPAWGCSVHMVWRE